MRDYLDQIISEQSAAAFRALPEGQRRALLVRHGSRAAAQAAAWAVLPEPVRLALVKSYGTAPAACGHEVPVAPARGPMQAIEMVESYPDGPEGTAVKNAGFAGRSTARRMDAFDRMAVQCARVSSEGLALTASQIGMGRIYGGLVMDHQAGGVRCIDLSAEVRGGSREGFTQARLIRARRIEWLRARVGDGVALSVRRVRPSTRGGARSNIPDRVIVDAVCVQDMTAGEVLRRFGWAEKGDTRAALMAALAGALDRMIGQVGPARMQVWRGAWAG